MTIAFDASAARKKVPIYKKDLKKGLHQFDTPDKPWHSNQVPTNNKRPRITHLHDTSGNNSLPVLLDGMIPLK